MHASLSRDALNIGSIFCKNPEALVCMENSGVLLGLWWSRPLHHCFLLLWITQEDGGTVTCEDGCCTAPVSQSSDFHVNRLLLFICGRPCLLLTFCSWILTF